ncbi:MAG: translocation/assembly module TamB domain-containing protein [Alcaligenaceae bacterium]|nr:translocation/assembly module TamB domain-containing protein [Alcaligenaceae bacterium]
MIWVLPALISLLVLIAGFAYWCVATEAGTRWTLGTVAQQLNGHAQGVHGTLAHGVSVEGLAIALPDLDVRIVGLHFEAAWPALLERHLRIRDLSAVRVSVMQRTHPTVDTEASDAFEFPALPVDVQIDRIALNGLDVNQDGQDLPIDLQALSAAIFLDRQSARIRLDTLDVAWDGMQVSLDGQLGLHGLAAPWPFDLDLRGFAQDGREDSPLCVRRVLGVDTEGDARRADCRIDMQTHLSGSLDGLTLAAQAQGAGLSLDAKAEVFPKLAFPLGQARVALDLPGGAGLTLVADPGPADAAGARRAQLQLAVRSLDLGAWLPEALGTSVISAQVRSGIGLDAQWRVQDISAQLSFDPGSRWNGQALSGSLKLDRVGLSGRPLFDPGQQHGFDPRDLMLSGLDTDLTLGSNHLRAQGDIAVARTKLDVDAQAPALAAFWPGIPGAAALHAALAGSLAQQTLSVDARYTPDHAREGVVGEAPAEAKLKVTGGWASVDGVAGWRGAVDTLDAEHADLSVRSDHPIALQYLLSEEGAAARWHVGAGQIQVSLSGESIVRLDHSSSEGQGTHWATAGRIDSLVISPKRIEMLQAWLGRGKEQEGGVHTALSERAQHSRLETSVDWSLKFSDALEGGLHIQRTAGDLVVPVDVPIELGLQHAALDVQIDRDGPGLSSVTAELQVRTQKMGNMQVRFQTPLHATPEGGLGLLAQDTKTIDLRAESEDLAWVNLFLQGAIEIGGTVHADVHGTSRPDGTWALSGPVSGENMSVLSLDQGIRLLNGTLKAHFDGDRVVLDGLKFPAVLRVTPKEWRTAEWVSSNPDAQGGSLTLSGQWNLIEQAGTVDVAFYRYPILQRSDRYAMISGDLHIDGRLPRVGVTGKIVADAGWFDLDMLNNIPSLDGDVVILEPGQTEVIDTGTPLDVDVAVSVDLGPRFYLTGYGVNSGLVGQMDIRMKQGKLTAIGALRTRGGSIDAYGQHLQLRRGTITFQGDITNPVISIEALRTDAAVQAGVRVAGTARRPRIDLVSYPDVSEGEKLTWLLLGHGPDDGGGDMALLFSVGSSFLSGGEPFYKRFGIDEFSMRSGELGSTGSILPVESVVGGLASGTSDIERRFIVAGKAVTKDLRVSIEQALSQTGTVGRLSYRLMRGLRAEVTAGTVSGLALVYRWFSMD